MNVIVRLEKQRIHYADYSIESGTFDVKGSAEEDALWKVLFDVAAPGLTLGDFLALGFSLITFYAANELFITLKK